MDFLDETAGMHDEYYTPQNPFYSLYGSTGCTIADILVFFTGAERIPPLGFEKTPTVTFLHQDALFATASTCDLKLRLPIKYGDDRKSFKDAMLMSIKDNDGFGAV